MWYIVVLINQEAPVNKDVQIAWTPASHLQIVVQNEAM